VIAPGVAILRLRGGAVLPLRLGLSPRTCHDETGVEEESLFPYMEIAGNSSPAAERA
jgi:hypothetical protein